MKRPGHHPSILYIITACVCVCVCVCVHVCVYVCVYVCMHACVSGDVHVPFCCIIHVHGVYVSQNECGTWDIACSYMYICSVPVVSTCTVSREGSM